MSDTFANLCDLMGLGRPETEYKFHPTRKWRADWCWVEEKVILEQDGGVWTGGRHSGGAGQVKDMEKLNAAAILGYRVLRVTPQQMKSGDVFELLRQALGKPA